MSKRSFNQFTYKSRTHTAPAAKFMVSATIPGQETHLKTILAQHARGMPLPEANRTPEYYGDLNVPDFAEMDLVDIMEYTTGVRDEIELLQKQIQDAENEAVKKRQQTASGKEPEKSEPIDSESED